MLDRKAKDHQRRGHLDLFADIGIRKLRGGDEDTSGQIERGETESVLCITKQLTDVFQSQLLSTKHKQSEGEDGEESVKRSRSSEGEHSQRGRKKAK